MSRTARTYVGVVVAAALVTIAVAAVVGAPLHGSDLPSIVGYATAFALVMLLPVPFPRGSSLELVRVEEAAVVPLVLLVDPLPALCAVVPGVLAGLLLTRNSPLKALFNTAQLTISIGATLLVVNLLAGGGSPGFGPAELGYASVGLVAMFVANQVLVGGILRLVSGSPFRSVVLDDLGAKTCMWLANGTLGMLVVLPAQRAPWVLLLALVPLVVLNAAWRVHADRSRDEQRLRELGTAVGDLSGELRAEHVARQLADGAREVVGAAGAQVRLLDPDRTWWARRTNDGQATAGQFEGSHDDRQGDAGGVAYAVPLTGSTGRLGELTVWLGSSDTTSGTQPALTHRDRTLLEMLAHQASAALDNAVLSAQSEQQRRTITQVFEHSSEGMLVLDRKGRIRGWNPAMQTMSGFATETVETSPISLLSPQLAAIVNASEPGTVDALISTADGRRRNVSASYAPIEGAAAGRDDAPADDGRSTRVDTDATWVVVVRDVTAEQETERLKDDFVATVSHELRTPLTAIKGFLETMRRDDIELSAGQVRMFLQIMGEQADRLERLIGDLLDMSAIESGRPLEVDLGPVDLGSTVQRSIATFTAARPDVQVDVVDRGPDLVVEADPHRLEQVLCNLLDNARKHGRTDAPIEVRVDRTPAGAATVSVTDRGKGISAVDQRRIFDRFFVAADSVTRTGGGAGLGLYICRRIMEAMGGAITVRSVVGTSTTFTVALPVLATSGTPVVAGIADETGDDSAEPGASKAHLMDAADQIDLVDGSSRR